MVRVPTHRQPTHPGEMLLDEFLKPMELTQRDLAEGIHVPVFMQNTPSGRDMVIDDIVQHQR